TPCLVFCAFTSLLLLVALLFFLFTRPPPTSTLFPYTTLFRSRRRRGGADFRGRRPRREHVQAPGRREGQQQPAAGPRRRAGSHRQPDRRHSGVRGAALGRRLGQSVSPQRITVLGATGSIGLSTLDVVARHPQRYEVFALTGHSRLPELEALC